MRHLRRFNESQSDSEKTIKYRDHGSNLESSLKNVKEFTKEELEKPF